MRKRVEQRGAAFMHNTLNVVLNDGDYYAVMLDGGEVGMLCSDFTLVEIPSDIFTSLGIPFYSIIEIVFSPPPFSNAVAKMRRFSEMTT